MIRPWKEGCRMTVHESLLAVDVIEDPHTYVGGLREEEPIHRNSLYETWVIT
jgi:hypothetical protein